MRMLTRLVVLSLGLGLLVVPATGAAPASGPPLSALRVVRADGGPTRIIDAQGRQEIGRAHV